MDDKNLDQLYHSRFDKLGVRPAPRNWDRIFQSLEVRRRRRRRALLWKSSGIAAVFLLTLGIAWIQSDLNKPEQGNSPVINTVSHQRQAPAATLPGNSNQEFWEEENLQAIILESPVATTQTSEQPQAIDNSLLGFNELELIPATPKLIAASEESSNSTAPEIFSAVVEEEPELTIAEAEALLRGNNEFLKDTDPKSKKWAVGPRVAPVYYSSLGGGSPLDPRFNSNPRAGKVNMSFGMAVAYQVKPRFKIRSGLHKVAYGYDTQAVEFSASPFSASYQKLKNVDYDFGAADVVVKSTQINRGTRSQQAKDVNAISASRSGNMRQELSYLEVPLEVQYELIDRKFGIDFIGGFSSMFLTGNTVSLRSEARATPMGEATNVNRINLSSNLGLGLRYNLNPGMQLRLEPMFKYHWNTFSGGTEGFRPYSMGVYSGLNIRF